MSEGQMKLGTQVKRGKVEYAGFTDLEITTNINSVFQRPPACSQV
jgi:hypothetical protein